MMEIPEIFESEYRFCLILWEHEPVSSGELVKLCEKSLQWKKSTTFTVIRRLCDRGVIKNENSVVTSLVSREQVQRKESRDFVDKTFDGSLPGFIAAFTSGKKLSREEADELKALIDSYTE